MELRWLRTFEAVVEHGTVTDAANALGLAPSSVSEHVRALERSVGTALFERGPKGMRANAAGERMRGWARRLLEDADRARRDVAGTGRAVRLGALETIAATHVPAVLARLAERRPGVRVEVRSDAARDQLLAGVASGDLDAALLLDSGDGVGGLGFAAPAVPLEFVDLERVPLALVASPGHRLAGARRVGRADLRGERLLVNVPACSFFLAGERLFGADVERVRAGSVTVMSAWAERGLGVALVPEFAVRDRLDAGALVALRVDGAELGLRLVWRGDREDLPGLRDVLYAASG
ncbi:LysR family transcriptional regulator [Actinomadura sp. WMMB 499]|uniref:LysR family transcriptional regulator n=1 Tax=Actinomadura sp. WMMB 499 TaxID=1219491 RepID=UPI0012482EEA|nr:LysR family transcriptional regulator [Actinomadura sp. WMMB 499]QFG26035.1 LysR family transcriptional regulator [Actinomadura sp. WMMB 499]